MLALIEHLPNMAPSVDRLMAMTGLGERTVRRELKALVAAGALAIEHRPGARSTYHLGPGLTLGDPCHVGTPATVAPLPELHPTPATVAPHPCQDGRTTPAKLAPEADNGSGQEKRTSKREARDAAAPPKSTPRGRVKKPTQAKGRSTSRPPAGWEPNDTHRALADAAGVDLAAEVAKCLDYHAAKGSTFADWSAALRTWLRNAKTFGHRHPAKANGHARPQPNAGHVNIDVEELG